MYYENEIKVSSQCKGREIELTGTVSQVSKNSLGRGEVVFYIDGVKYKKILVEFDKTTTKKLSSLKKGSFLTVRCKTKNFEAGTLFVEASGIVPR